MSGVRVTTLIMRPHATSPSAASRSIADVDVDEESHPDARSPSSFSSSSSVKEAAAAAGAEEAVWKDETLIASPTGIVYDAHSQQFTITDTSESVRAIRTLRLGDRSVDTLTSLPEGPAFMAYDPDGILYVTCSDHSIRTVNLRGAIEVFAGQPGCRGFADGPSYQAQFSYPNGIAVGSRNQLLVCDSRNNRIRLIERDGVVSTLAGSDAGYADGDGITAKFSAPFGITMDEKDNAYITDFFNNRIRRVTADGVVTTLAGSEEGNVDGIGTAARLHRPRGIVLDRNCGALYVSDWHRILRVFISNGEVHTIAGSSVAGVNDGAGQNAQFDRPLGLSLDGDGNAWSLFVCDTSNGIIRCVELVTVEDVMRSLHGCIAINELPPGILPIILNYLFASA